MLREYRSVASEGRLGEAGRYAEHVEYLAHAAPTAELGYQLDDAMLALCIGSRDFARVEEVLEERVRRYTRDHDIDRLAQTWYHTAYMYNAQGQTVEEIGALQRAVELRPGFYDALAACGTALGTRARAKPGGEQEWLFAQACEK